MYLTQFTTSDLYPSALAVYRLPTDIMSDLEAKDKKEEKDEKEYEIKKICKV